MLLRLSKRRSGWHPRHEDRFLQSDFVFQQPDGKKSTGLGIIGFEVETGKFTSFWTDSRSTRLSIRQSEGKFNGQEIVLFSKSLEPDAKEARRSRTVTRLEENGRKLVHRQYSIGSDGNDRKRASPTAGVRTAPRSRPRSASATAD